ncbi:MAG: kelch repeat-containing protein, partial [Verrucomicrobiales bacterium]|nr:kelch repeat-containing protein [Verrucomicrobiales bacterium]
MKTSAFAQSARTATSVLALIAILSAPLLLHLLSLPAGSATSEQIAPAGQLITPRADHTATLLPDGRVLLVGGRDAHGELASAEVFDPATRAFSAVGAMTFARAGHTATLLPDGRVLIAGGAHLGLSLGSAEIFDPQTGAFGPPVPLAAARSGHSATVLDDGRVILAGGNAEGSVEIFDPTTHQSTLLSSGLSEARVGHAAALGAGGLFIIGGGTDTSEHLSFEEWTFSVSPYKADRILAALDTVATSDHNLMLFGQDAAGTSLFGTYSKSSRAFGIAYELETPGSTAVLLANQKVLVLSLTQPGLYSPAPPYAEDNARFEALPHGTALQRAGATATELLADRKILIAGGVAPDNSGTAQPDGPGGPGPGQTVLGTAVLFNPAKVVTDKDDYQPGDFVFLYGSGWLPGEVVDIYVVDNSVTEPEWYYDVSITADADGNFIAEPYLFEVLLDHLGVTFDLSAVGTTSGLIAQVQFTDASPGSLGNYATAGLPNSPVPTSVSPSNVAAGVTFSNLTRGSGLTPEGTADAFNSSSWPTTSTLTISGNTDYYEFTITPNPCRKFSASELRVGLQRSSNGPKKVELRSSLDSYATTIGSVIDLSTTSLTTFTINLSPVAGLQNRSSAVTLRIYGYDANSAPGTLRIQRVITPPMVGLEVDGTVAVHDITPPTITCPGTQTLVLGSGCTATLPNYTGLATTSDNCATTITVTQSPAAGTVVSGVGTLAVTLTANDGNGNTASCSFTVNKVDTTAPTIGSPGANTTIQCPATPDFTPPTATDNCDPTPSIVEVSDVTTPGSCPGTYTRTKTWKAVDASGNQSGTVSQTIT